MSAPSFTYSGNVYTAGTAGTVDFALTSTTGNSIPYLEPGHIHVYKSSNQGTSWTELTRPAQWDFVTSGTVARLVTGIAAGEWVKVQRITPSSAAYVTFQASSLLTADQLNDDTLFNTYLNQERYDQGDQSSVVAAAAQAASTSATTTANTALSTANAASASAASAVTTANTASTNASAAVATANTASTNASAAASTANTASTNASAAVTTANTASTNASAAVATANTALSTANSAVTTANNANTTAQAANTTAANAQSVANSALNLVTGVVNFVPVANVAAIPASPNNDDAVQVVDSTGIQSFTPLTGLPAGFTGTPQLFVRLQYNSTGTTWEYSGYGANDPDKRYVVQGVLGTANNPSFYFDADTGFYSPGSNELGLSTGGAARLTIDSSGNVAVPGTLSVTGALTKGGNNVVTTGDTGTVTSAMLADGTVVDADISGTAAISLSKLATGALPTAITVASANIVDGTIVNADVNASAAIAGTKISPDFGSQNVTTTGTATAAALIPSGSSVPTNGVYLPSANNVAISTNGTGRLFVDSSGRVGVGTSSVGELLHLNGASAALQVQDSGATNSIGKIINSGGILYIQSQNNTSHGQIVFRTSDGSATERMRLDASGRLGLGTSSPYSGRLTVIPAAPTPTTVANANQINVGEASINSNYRLQVGYFYDTAGRGSIQSYDNGNPGSLILNGAGGNVGIGSNATSPTQQLHVKTDQAAYTWTRIDNQSSSASAYAGLQLGAFGNTWGLAVGSSAANSNSLTFVLDAGGTNSEKMRLDTSGRLLVGTSTSRGRITSEPTAGDWGLGVNDATAGTQSFAAFRYSGTLIGSIVGNNTATAYNTSSDYRLKENVVPLTGAIDRVNQLQVHRFNFIADPDKTVDGFIAHEAQEVVPECVTGEKDAVDDDGNPVYQGIDQSKLVPLLTAALQEALAKIETLEARLTAAGI